MKGNGKNGVKLSFLGKTGQIKPEKAKVREHGPYYEGGPRLLTYEFEEPMLMRGKLVRSYTMLVYV
jgi:hypothetical protein